MKEIICLVKGHIFRKSETEKPFIARCERCLQVHEVSYDMLYGGTYSVRRIRNYNDF